MKQPLLVILTGTQAGGVGDRDRERRPVRGVAEAKLSYFAINGASEVHATR